MSRAALLTAVVFVAGLSGCVVSTDGSEAAERYLRGPEATLAGQRIVDASCQEYGDGDVECKVSAADGTDGRCNGNVRDGDPTGLRCEPR